MVRLKQKSIFHKVRWIYVLYAAILLLFIINIAFEIKASITEGDEDMSCGDYGCDCSECKCGTIEAEDTDSDNNETNSTNTTETVPASTCTDDRTVTSSTSGELWTYSFSIVCCNASTASVYLKASSASATYAPGSAIPTTTSGGTLYLYSGQSVAEGGSLTGGGQRAVSDGYSQVCINVGGTETCS